MAKRVKELKALEKYYTKPEVAEDCSDIFIKFLPSSCKLIVEPCAGAGVFLDACKYHSLNIKGYDIEPEREDIEKVDFTYGKPFEQSEPFAVLTNPPFKLITELFAQIYDKCSLIGLIIPNSGRKEIINFLDTRKSWKLVYYGRLQEKAFTINGKDYAVASYFIVLIKDDNTSESLANTFKKLKLDDEHQTNETNLYVYKVRTIEWVKAYLKALCTTRGIDFNSIDLSKLDDIHNKYLKRIKLYNEGTYIDYCNKVLTESNINYDLINLINNQKNKVMENKSLEESIKEMLSGVVIPPMKPNTRKVKAKKSVWSIQLVAGSPHIRVKNELLKEVLDFTVTTTEAKSALDGDKIIFHTMVKGVDEKIFVVVNDNLEDAEAICSEAICSSEDFDLLCKRNPECTPEQIKEITLKQMLYVSIQPMLEESLPKKHEATKLKCRLTQSTFQSKKLWDLLGGLKDKHVNYKAEVINDDSIGKTIKIDLSSRTEAEIRESKPKGESKSKGAENFAVAAKKLKEKREKEKRENKEEVK